MCETPTQILFRSRRQGLVRSTIVIRWKKSVDWTFYRLVVEIDRSDVGARGGPKRLD